MSTPPASEGNNSQVRLTSRIRMLQPIKQTPPPPPDQETWPPYLQMQHPSATLTYSSGSLGDFQIRLPPTPTSNEDSNLLAHYLWDSSLLLSHLIANPSPHDHPLRWSVQGLHVLELGAGTGLVGITCAVAGAERTVLTDYPSLHILDNIRQNVETNVFSREQASSRLGRKNGVVSVEAHKWGDLDGVFAKGNAHGFTRVVATGCLWRDEQHGNIARSMRHFLKDSADAEVWVVSGFFLGREKLAGFFEVAGREGLVVREVFEQNGMGERREWSVERRGEEDKEIVEQGWLLVGVLCHGNGGLSR